MPTQSELFQSNLDLVPKICSRWNYDTPTMGDDDRRSMAKIELWESASRYDGARPFRSYAAVRIANALRNAMRDDARSRRISNQSVSFDFLSELADDGTLTDDEYQSAITDQSTSADDELSDHDDLQTVRAAVDALPPAQAAVIKRRYLGDELEKLADIGADQGVSRERIRQIETEALGKLRKRLVR